MNRSPENPLKTWRWYTQKTATCVPLDLGAYPSTTFDGHPIPWPNWACRQRNGGVHLDDRRGRVDVHVAKRPLKQLDFTWTCDFHIHVVQNSWLNQIADLIDEKSSFKGLLYNEGEILAEWSTLHGHSWPTLMSTRGQTQICMNCGGVSHFRDGGVFFSDPAVLDRKLIVNGNGIFVREDEAARRDLRQPRGAFKFGRVRFDALGQRLKLV